jgi:ABC-type multidrug transport system fused ATPase/permease subunit
MGEFTMDRISSYFKLERKTLFFVLISGFLYNAGITVGPWFEGKLAQCLYDVMAGNKTFTDMVILAGAYILSIALVQLMRSIKRFYVRRFANNVNRRMKHILYNNLIHRPTIEFQQESVGQMMTKAIADVDACSEGMRKVTTEIFDTGVAMISYLVMLFVYDWHLALLSIIFPPFAYVIAQWLKKTVTHCTFVFRESAGRLNAASLDRISNALTYRVYGLEEKQDDLYEEKLVDYEKKAVRADVWENTMQPMYKIISMASMIFILWFGAKNVMGTGWTTWNLAAFTTFQSCFNKLALKSSRAAKLFNAVQKAEVSWERIKPLMKKMVKVEELEQKKISLLSVRELAFSYPKGAQIFCNVSFEAKSGEVIGITGSVASGKSTLGKTFLCESPYQGEILVDGKSLQEMSNLERCALIGYMGHQPELMSDTIEENIRLGEQTSVESYLQAVCLEEEVKQMPSGKQTVVGNGGVRLSGGQQARVAIARTLYHKKPIMIFDDPFSAVDAKTELEIMKNIRKFTKDCIVLIISHRLYLFPSFDKIIWLEEGRSQVGTHEELMFQNREYVNLYEIQTKGEKDNADSI